MKQEHSLFFSDNQEEATAQQPTPCKREAGSGVKLEEAASGLSSSRVGFSTEITRWTFHRMFFELCEDVEGLTYSPAPAEPDFFAWAFREAVEDLNSSKLRSSLLRRVTEDFVREHAQIQGQGRRELQRMTAVERRLYERAGIQPPPSTLNAEYIARVFEHAQFRKYFQEYVGGDRVAEHYLARCHEEAMEVCRFLEKCKTCDSATQAEFSKLRKPMTLAEVRNFETEAARLIDAYCK